MLENPEHSGTERNGTEWNGMEWNGMEPCHGESSIPELLYPHTKVPSEYCTPVHDSLVNHVWGYKIGVVD